MKVNINKLHNYNLNNNRNEFKVKDLEENIYD